MSDREVKFIQIFPQPSHFIRWLVDLNIISHIAQAIDYTEDIKVTDVEIDNLLKEYMLFIIRNSDVIERTLEIVRPEIDQWKQYNKDRLKNEDNPT